MSSAPFTVFRHEIQEASTDYNRADLEDLITRFAPDRAEHIESLTDSELARVVGELIAAPTDDLYDELLDATSDDQELIGKGPWRIRHNDPGQPGKETYDPDPVTTRRYTR